MTPEDVKKDLRTLLPKRDVPFSSTSTQDSVNEGLDKQVDKIQRKKSDEEIRRLQRRAYSELKHNNKLDPDHYQEYELLTAKELEEEYRPALAGEHIHLNGTTPTQVARLLKSMNISLDIQLTKNDTKNLLATLLTCNEYQLKALQTNKKTPMAIRTVIKAIINAEKDGNMEIVERLWNRIFGPTGFQLEMPASMAGQSTVQNGLLPQSPVSREAYLLIRETLIGMKE